MASSEAGAAVRSVLLGALLASALTFAFTRSDPPPAFGKVVMVDGIPHVSYGDAGVQANPVTVTKWALDGHLIEGADWLVGEQRGDGSWRYDFDYMVTGRVELEAGWASGMAQGRAMSVLVRAYEETGDRRYLSAADAAFRFLMTGEVRTTLEGGLWFEEYPTDPPSHVLNGAIYTLNGLWDAREVVPGAADAYDEARATIEANLGRWDDDGRVVYDLLHAEIGGAPHYDPSYDPIHERLLRGMLEQRDSETVRHWLAVWFATADVPGR